jgi:hypothetical protein
MYVAMFLHPLVLHNVDLWRVLGLFAFLFQQISAPSMDQVEHTATAVRCMQSDVELLRILPPPCPASPVDTAHQWIGHLCDASGGVTIQHDAS